MDSLIVVQNEIEMRFMEEKYWLLICNFTIDTLYF